MPSLLPASGICLSSCWSHAFAGPHLYHMSIHLQGLSTAVLRAGLGQCSISQQVLRSTDLQECASSSAVCLQVGGLHQGRHRATGRLGEASMARHLGISSLGPSAGDMQGPRWAIKVCH